MARNEIITKRLKLLNPPREEVIKYINVNNLYVNLIFLQFDKDISELFNSPIEMEYLPALSRLDTGGWSIEDARQRREYQEQTQRQGLSFNCVATLHTGEFVGVCGLRSIDPHIKAGEMGIAIKREYWGQNFSAEIHLALLEYCFESLGLNRITFATSSRNTPMIQFCRNILLATHEGTLRDFFPLGTREDNNSFESAELFTILRSEWERTKENLILKLTK